MFGETGCCGADFNTERTTVFGLMTLSVPLLALGCLALILVAPGCLVSAGVRRLAGRIIVINSANWKLIQSSPLIPRLRCSLAGIFFGFSPRFSGFIYRWFNLAVLMSLWSVIIGVVITAIIAVWS
tara:strand:- start:253 stop:630 length:378 start_codon:yes stop_codon:yes gene_type:complete